MVVVGATSGAFTVIIIATWWTVLYQRPPIGTLILRTVLHTHDDARTTAAAATMRRLEE
jgi:predicted secreted protein